MNKGAHYHRCDLQVHTPCDLQWTGADRVTSPEDGGQSPVPRGRRARAGV